jgi:hypothetical protein
MISTREELITALSEAAELEHGLLVQYLFAAYSLKRRANEGLSASQQLLTADWISAILHVAQEEMTHLANVCNLLSAVGGAPQFGRPNFPQSNGSSFCLDKATQANRYYPFDFELEKFSDEALYRFIICEMPKDAPLPLPPDQFYIEHMPCESKLSFREIYNNVGELYRIIQEGFIQIPEAELFIGSRKHQSADGRLVVDLQSALQTIQQIVFEGEGALSDNLESHYERFVSIRNKLCEERQADPTFEPARTIASNPKTRPHRDASGSGTLITHEVTLGVANLFNQAYTTLLMILIQQYSFDDETKSQREALQRAGRGLMHSAIRPLADVLTELPVTTAPNSPMAGPCFEIHSPVRLSSDLTIRQRILQERLQQATTTSKDILKHQNHFPVLARLNNVSDNLTFMAVNLKNAFDVE